MAIFHFSEESIEPVEATTFAEQNIFERYDLQRLLKDNIQVVATDILIISEEFGEWIDSKRRVDLLGIDSDGAIVVIEIKRDATGDHMELQAIRYAAMVANMTFDRAVDTYQRYLDRSETDGAADARSGLLEFLDWDEPREDEFGQNVRIVLVAADFSKEMTTAVLWLNERDLDIRCVRLKPYIFDNQTLVDVQQVVPLPEAQEYMVRIREKAIEEREAARKDTGYWFMNTGDNGENRGRCWEDCKRYGFMLAGGGEKWTRKIKRLQIGDKLFAYLSGHGYVGLAEVTAPAVPMKSFRPAGHDRCLHELQLTGTIDLERMNDPQFCDWCVAVKWMYALEREHAMLSHRARRSTLERIRQPELVAELLQYFEMKK